MKERNNNNSDVKLKPPIDHNLSKKKLKFLDIFDLPTSYNHISYSLGD